MRRDFDPAHMDQTDGFFSVQILGRQQSICISQTHTAHKTGVGLRLNMFYLNTEKQSEGCDTCSHNDPERSSEELPSCEILHKGIGKLSVNLSDLTRWKIGQLTH